MMRGEFKIKYDPTDPNDVGEVKVLMKSKDLYLGLHELREELRMKLKHGSEFKTADEALEWMRDEVIDIMGTEELLP